MLRIMQCHNCDAGMGKNDNFCVICGVPRKGGIILCPICKQTINSTKGEFCSNCGEYLKRGRTAVTK